MTSQTLQPIHSWGRLPSTQSHRIRRFWADEPFPNLPDLVAPWGVLPFGLGRSYGDSCLNDRGAILDVSGMNLFHSFDSKSGLLRCDSGMSLDQILQCFVQRGWFLPVTPGTKFVTVGGAIANDIHGKNHHQAGTFGCHVPRFELLRSDGSRQVCSSAQNVDLYRATIGGLGLTGLITWAELKLIPITSAWIDMESLPFKHLDEFFTLNAESELTWPYTVAWIDGLASGAQLGRGIYLRGRHAERGTLQSHRPSKWTIPFNAPNWLLNRWTVSVFNNLYYQVKGLKNAKTIHYDPFFYPLDGIHHWNRIYGRRGFYQYQTVVPMVGGPEAIKTLLHLIAESRQASFLAVLKTFGDTNSPGLLSFPRRGYTLALDFPNAGYKTIQLFRRLDEVVREVGGVLYPAKDACMNAKDFKRFYPQWEKLETLRDPHIHSSFWRRVTGITGESRAS